MKTEFHIGELIEKRLDEVGMTKAEFGRRIDVSRQNVNTILKKHSLDVGQLVIISRVLGHDFLRYFAELGPNKPPLQKKQTEYSAPIISVQLNLFELQRILKDMKKIM